MRSFCILTSWRTVWIVSWEYQLHLKCSVVERGTSCNQEAVNKLANYSQVNVDKFHIYSSDSKQHGSGKTHWVLEYLRTLPQYCPH